MQPPLGYTFPKTFIKGNVRYEYKVWVNNIDQSTKVNRKYFWPNLSDKDYEIPNNMSIKFKTKDLLSINLTGEMDDINYKYFISKDTLFVVDNNFEIPLFKGNFNEITVSRSHLYISETSEINGANMFNVYKESGLSFLIDKNSPAITGSGMLNPDTIAYHNAYAIFR